MRLLFFIGFIILFSGIYAQSTQFKTITIEPSKSFQNYEHFRKLVLDSPDSQLEYLEHFNFEWGYEYKVRVRETKLQQTLSDGTQYEYTFDKIISKTKVPDSTVFRLYLNGNLYYYKVDSTEFEESRTIRMINDSTFLYFEEVEIEVPSNLIDTFKEIAKGNAERSGQFVFISPKRIRLVAFN
jgi:hypothetical protein